jgi:hypothetical protein
MDMAPLQQAFPSPAPEVQASLEKFRMAIRYGQFEPALVELDKLAQLPDLTEAQKKAVNDKIEQVKQRLSSAAKPPQ